MSDPRHAAPDLRPVEPRDYVAEMNAIIEAETANAVYSAPMVASRIVAMLRLSDTDLLAGWLDIGAEGIVNDAINKRDRALRARARANRPRNEFALAAQRFRDGDASALASWLEVPFVVEGNRRKPLGRMTSADLCYVADDYSARATSAKFEAEWLRVIAERVGDGVVADHFSDQQLHDMRVSLAGS